MFDLSGCRALVTGASGGLGAHFAKVLAGHGAEVVLTARRIAALEIQAAEILAQGGKASFAALDVTDAPMVADVVGGLGRIDILINNAGVVRTAPALEQSEADWDCIIDTDLKGMFLVAQAVARSMRGAKRGGTIVNVASILGIRQTGTVLPYAVAKAGVIQMTKILALELARFDIRVNALAPGYLATDLNRRFFDTEPGREMVRRIPMRRLGMLADLDGPLLLLASDASRYMSGAALVVDGGHLVSAL